jgi:hypothetical protein
MDRPEPNRRRRRAALALLLFLLALLTWWLWPDGRLARARDLQRGLFAESGRSLPPEQRRAKFTEFRQAMAGLSPWQRAELGQDMMKRRMEELKRYAKMSPSEKRKALDNDIRRQEEMRRRRQANGGPARPGGGAAGPGGPRGLGGRPQTPEEREQRRQRRLDHTTPEFRALTDQYRRDLAARRQQLGLPPAPGFIGPR